MDLGLETVPGIVASGTTAYLAQFSPIFLLIGGLMLAVVTIALLLGVFFKRSVDPFADLPEFDDDLADELEDFYGRHGQTDAPYNYDDIVSTYK